jgi:hypothetical protein
MFDELTKKYLSENPFSIIAGEFYKFDSVCMTESGQQVVIFKSVVSGEKKQFGFVELQNIELSPFITAIGLLNETVLELKRAVEIANLK